jgi:serine/threonine protein phosphatase PrpC
MPRASEIVKNSRIHLGIPIFLIMAVIADGMGGLSHGKQVSEVVVKEMISRFSDIIQNEPIASQLEDIVDAINNEVCENLLEKNSISAGTTLASICIFKQFAFWLSVGDSRIYLKRHNALYQLNEDNDYYNQLLSEYIFGIGTIEAAKNDKQKDSLTSYIGNPKLPYVDYNKRALEILENDEFLLCSDGVYNALSNDELLECMKDEPQHASEKIIKKVTSKKSPGQDNSTVMLIKINFKESE